MSCIRTDHADGSYKNSRGFLPKRLLLQAVTSPQSCDLGCFGSRWPLPSNVYLVSSRRNERVEARKPTKWVLAPKFASGPILPLLSFRFRICKMKIKMSTALSTLSNAPEDNMKTSHGQKLAVGCCIEIELVKLFLRISKNILWRLHSLVTGYVK